MATSPQKLVELEQKFWQALVDQDAETATELLAEPSLMVSAHGAMKFDRAGFRKMAVQGSTVITGFELRDIDVVFPNSSTAIVTYKVKQSVRPRNDATVQVQEMHDTSMWVQSGDDWRCAMHTETPVQSSHTQH
jgi:ketosteroid isomerase-like protein